MDYKKGGFIPGKAKVKGNSIKNDTVKARLSPGEIVIPRETVAKGPSAMAEFALHAIAKHKSHFDQGGEVEEPSVWDNIKSSFDEPEKPQNSKAPQLDKQKAKTFSNVFNTETYYEGGVVGGFDPDKFLKETETKSFDPDKFLSETGGPEEKSFLNKEIPIIGGTPRGYIKGALSTLPTIGAVGGGLIGGTAGMAATPIGAAAAGVGGAALGGMAGKELERAGNQYLLGEAQTSGLEHAKESVGAGLSSASQEMGGQILNAGIGKAGEVLSKYGKNKVNAGEIRSATNALGAEPTPGMISSDPYIQKTESSLEQSPSVGGYLTRKGTQPVKNAISSASENVFKDIENVQPSEAGSKIKANLTKQIKDSLDTIGSYYDDIRLSSKNIDVPDKSIEAVARNIENVDKFESSPGSALAKKIANDLRNVSNADDLKNLRSNVGKALGNRNLDPRESAAISEIYGKLSNLERNSYMRAAIDSAKENIGSGLSGKNIGKELVSDLKSANKQYSGLINNIKDLSRDSGLGKNIKNPYQFLNKLDELPDEKVVDQFFKTNNREYLQNLQKFSPDQFNALRSAKMASIRRDVSSLDGTINPSKLIKYVSDMEPKTQEVVFGKSGTDLLNHIKTVISSLPEKVGPSGTPAGLEWGDFFSPSAVMRQGSRLMQYGIYKNKPAINAAGGLLQNASSQNYGRSISGLLGGNK